MKTLRLIAIFMLIYVLGTGDIAALFLALLIWEISTGFKGSTVLWFTKDK